MPMMISQSCLGYGQWWCDQLVRFQGKTNDINLPEFPATRQLVGQVLFFVRLHRFLAREESIVPFPFPCWKMARP